MCNPRPLNESSDDELSISSHSLFDVSKLALKAVPSGNSCSITATTITTTAPIPRARSGRKGDPRMHKALEIRLANPKLSLLDSLTRGGFEFHKVDGVWYDKDNILLSQRKNQLSRRVRLYKQNQLKQTGDLSACSGQAVCMEKAPIKDKEESKKRSTKAQDELKRCTGRLHKPSSRKKQKLAADSDAAMIDSCSATGSVVVSSASQKGSPIPTTIASSEGNFGDGTKMDIALQSEHFKSQSENNEKFEQAVNLYLKKSSELMTSCLETAGFSKEECKEDGELFSKFVGRVMAGESLRLKTMQSSSSTAKTVSVNSLNSSQDGATTTTPYTLRSESSIQEDVGSSYAFAAGGNDHNQIHPTTKTSNVITASKPFIESMNFTALQQMQHPVPSSSFYPQMNNQMNASFNHNYSQYPQWDVTSNNYPKSSGTWCITNQSSVVPNTSSDEMMRSSLSYHLHDNDQFKHQDAMVSITQKNFFLFFPLKKSHFPSSLFSSCVRYFIRN